jgi:hypothetical protein
VRASRIAWREITIKPANVAAIAVAMNRQAGGHRRAAHPTRFAVEARSRLVSVHQTTYKCAAMTGLARLFREAKPFSG